MIATLFATMLLATPAAQAQDAPPAKEKLICRRDQAVGTRLAARTCLTASQWKEREEASRDSRDDTMRNADRTGRDGYLPYAKPGK